MSEVKRYVFDTDTGDGLPGVREATQEDDFYSVNPKYVLHSDYAALPAKLSAVQAGADRLREALKDAKKTVEKRFLECGRQGANAHMTNPLRTEWEHCRATLHEIDAALAAYQAGTGAVDAKEVFTWETCPKHEWREHEDQTGKAVVCIHCQMPGEQQEDGTVFFPAT